MVLVLPVNSFLLSMLTKQDMLLLRGMFSEVLTQNNVELKRDIRDEVHALIAASEDRMLGRMELMKHEIIEFLDQTILPQIHELQLKVG